MAVLKLRLVAPNNRQEPSRVVVYGTINSAEGDPVLAVLELKERKKGGQVLDVQVVKNAYAKDHDIQGQFENSEITYLDSDKNRTDTWLQGARLQLPLDATHYGSMGSMSYTGNYVKLQGTPYSEVFGRRSDTAEAPVEQGISSV